MNNETLIVDGIEVQGLGDIKPIVSFDSSEYQLVVVNNQIIQNKMIVFKNNRVYCCLDLTENSSIHEQYPKNELIKIKQFEVFDNGKRIG